MTLFFFLGLLFVTVLEGTCWWLMAALIFYYLKAILGELTVMFANAAEYDLGVEIELCAIAATAALLPIPEKSYFFSLIFDL